MNFNWTFMIDFALLSLFLGIATYLKHSFTFFQKYLIPNAMIAGFIGLILGPGALNLLPLDPDRMGTLVYHLMAVGFIALALKDRDRDNNKYVGKTGMFIVATYLIQGIVGFGLTLALVYTAYPDLFPAFGLLLPLGYGQGPGQAYSIGAQWETQGFPYGGSIGLTIATLGYLWACLGGIPLMNYLIKRKKYPLEDHTRETKSMIHEEDTPGDMPLSESIDRITIQFFLIGIVYLATYVSLQGISHMLAPLGTFGQTLAQLLWGFHFIIGSLFAILLRVIFDFMKKKKIMIRNYPNNYLLQRISGGCFDFMITASIAAISLGIVMEYIVPIGLISTVGGFVTIFFTIYVCKRIYLKHHLENILALYGMLTGTISTGLALLREVDPNFRSEAAENLVLGSGVGLFLGFPLMILLNVPIFGYISGQPIMYLYTMLGLVAYFSVLMIVMLRKGKRSK